jgi:heptose-I-phosphate ethanolaminephosphotransferase
LLANLYLLSPVFLYDAFGYGKPGSGVDRIIVFTLIVSMLGLAVLQLTVRRLWIAHLALFPFYVLVQVDLFLIVHYQTRLSSSSISLLLENIADAPAYIELHKWQVLQATVMFTVVYVLCMRGMRRMPDRPVSRRRVLFAATALAAAYGLFLGKSIKVCGSLRPGLLETLSSDRSSPFGVFGQGYVAYAIYDDAREHQRRSRSFRFGATRPQPVPGREIYVMFVGESSRPDHWSLYGYDRPTTPHLSAEPHLVVFRDVISQIALTQMAVPLLLTRAKVDEVEKYADERSVVSAFKEAGFTTTWLSTQQRDTFTGAVNRYSSEADDARFFDRQRDGVLVDAMKASIAESPADAKLFFVIHTSGSHFVYKSRYPKGFGPFPDEGHLSDHELMINAYDNSIAYTDVVVSQAIEVLREAGGTTALWYSSDHAENLEDDDRALLGHDLNNEYDLPVPMVFWYSEAFEGRFGAKVATARGNARKSMSSRVVFYSLLDMGAIHVDDPLATQLSVLGPELSFVPRIVVKAGVPFDYDAWAREQNVPRVVTRN